MEWGAENGRSSIDPSAAPDGVHDLDVVFRLDKQGGVWSVSEPEGMTADAAAVEAWFETVRGLAIREFVDDPDFAALGLDEPSGRLTFWLPPTPDQDEGDVAVSLPGSTRPIGRPRPTG